MLVQWVSARADIPLGGQLTVPGTSLVGILVSIEQRLDMLRNILLCTGQRPHHQSQPQESAVTVLSLRAISDFSTVFQTYWWPSHQECTQLSLLMVLTASPQPRPAQELKRTWGPRGGGGAGCF